MTRSAVAPRLLPAEITLVTANARSALASLIASTVGAGRAAGIGLFGGGRRRRLGAAHRHRRVPGGGGPGSAAAGRGRLSPLPEPATWRPGQPGAAGAAELPARARATVSATRPGRRAPAAPRPAPDGRSGGLDGTSAVRRARCRSQPAGSAGGSRGLGTWSVGRGDGRQRHAARLLRLHDLLPRVPAADRALRLHVRQGRARRNDRRGRAGRLLGTAIGAGAASPGRRRPSCSCMLVPATVVTAACAVFFGLWAALVVAASPLFGQALVEAGPRLDPAARDRRGDPLVHLRRVRDAAPAVLGGGRPGRTGDVADVQRGGGPGRRRGGPGRVRWWSCWPGGAASPPHVAEAERPSHPRPGQSSARASLAHAALQAAGAAQASTSSGDGAQDAQRSSWRPGCPGACPAGRCSTRCPAA